MDNDWSQANIEMMTRWSRLNFPLKIAYEGPKHKFDNLIGVLNKIDIVRVNWKMNKNMMKAKESLLKFKWFTLTSRTLCNLRTFEAVEKLHLQDQYIWTIEKDVAFMGNPKLFFDSYITSESDLISSTYGYADNTYWAFRPRTLLANATYDARRWPWNVSKIKKDVVIWRAVMVERVSPKLLKFMENLTDNGLFMQSEIFESTVCYNENWCSMQSWDEHTKWKSKYFVPNTGRLRLRFPTCDIVSRCCKNQFVHPLFELKNEMGCNATLR